MKQQKNTKYNSERKKNVPMHSTKGFNFSSIRQQSSFPAPKNYDITSPRILHGEEFIKKPLGVEQRRNL